MSNVLIQTKLIKLKVYHKCIKEWKKYDWN